MYRPTEEQCLKEPGFKIHSIKRLSDSEIFTIGDKFNIPDNKFFGTEQIEGFAIIDNQIWLTNGDITLNNIEKVKQPLFTTEDDVDIFEGNNYFKVVNESFQLLKMENASKGESLRSKVFSTKEKAEEYILMNKPVLSYNDIEKIITTSSKMRIDLLRRIKNEVKQTLKQ